ncbi:16S rRNA (cytosine(967)-C(5))-methyltransferase RsmB [Desulfobotulus sp. H1]|uniref:16S rRNA (cytosine(967)-C(5))-methyltransferase n=1 Tax=Desulfobotulus pelophilus TaxID=2823377 RepID=A0ABT3N8I1_9BACT|nr:16S rRNA (cytosine(967)-C(5))-methyltransferase RsmB [Desulfobotulus pelophilus]MCW7753749.1 16S rRNA (cytosine(967)-C(5))-methyltransferase RsmB [Desulfobotulus pelophilus]
MQSDARKTALQVLIKIQAKHLPLDLVIEDFQSTINAMDPKDRRLMNAIVYGVLRWRSRLDRVIGASSRTPIQKIEPKIRDILRIAIFQLIYLDRVPESAAIHTAVELTKHISTTRGAPGFVNGVLRNAQKSWKEVYDPPENEPFTARMAWKHAIPEWMLLRWTARFGETKTALLSQYVNRIPAMTLRVNRLRTDTESLKALLDDKVKEITPNPWVPDALDFSHPEGSIDRLPGFKDGFFQIQDAAAQLATFMLAPRPGERILDACAGYGGKTGHMALLMQNKGDITAADINGSKLMRLSHEMERLGVHIVKTRTLDLTRGDAAMNLGRFDRILLDAPCSGMGVIRRNPDIKWNRDEKSLEHFSRRQAELLDTLAGLLKPGGLMVYAVCSTEPEETTEVVNAFLERHPEMKKEAPGTKFPQEARALITEQNDFMPWQETFELDGFFATAFRKSGRRKVVTS